MQLNQLPAYADMLRAKARAYDSLARAIEDAFGTSVATAPLDQKMAIAALSAEGERENLEPNASTAVQPDLAATLRQFASGRAGRLKEFAKRLNLPAESLRQVIEAPGSGMVVRHGWVKLTHVDPSQLTDQTATARSAQTARLDVETLRARIAIGPVRVGDVCRECDVAESVILGLVQQPGSKLVIIKGTVMSAT